MTGLAARIALALGLTLALGLAGPAMADTALKRLTLRSDGLGWEAIGRLEFDGGYCTGVLIATDLVLTAGHCAYDRARGALRPVASMRFRAGLRDGSAVAEARAARSAVDPVYAAAGTPRLTQIAHDVALIQLDQPIPAATAAPFQLGPAPRAGDEVAVVSYARGRSDAQSWQSACRVEAARGALVAVSCDVTHGSSGAPIFSGGTDGRPAIVSMVSSGGTLPGGRKVALGMLLPDEVAALEQALESGQGLIATADPDRIGRAAPLSANVSRGAKFLRP